MDNENRRPTDTNRARAGGNMPPRSGAAVGGANGHTGEGGRRNPNHNIVSPDSVFSSQSAANGSRRGNEAGHGRGHQGEHNNSHNSASHGEHKDSTRSEHRSGERSHSSSGSKKSHRRKYKVNSTLILIIVSAVISVLIFTGVFISHMNSVNNIENTETEGESEYQSGKKEDFIAKIELYSLDSDEVIPKTVFPIVKILDANGNPVIFPIREKNGDISGTFVYEYDKDGAKLSEKKYGRDRRLIYKDVVGGKDEGTARTLYETEFDNKNNYSGYTETLFDENGIIILKTKCSSNGVVEGKYDYEYDSEGRVIRENRYTTYGELSVSAEYKYDAFGNNTEIIQKDVAGKEVLRDVMAYDSENRLTLEEHYTLGVRKSYSEYTYDEYGNPTKKSYVLADEYTMTYKEAP